VSANSLLRRIFDLREGKLQEDGEKYIMRIFIIFALNQILE
jgi:hypothetical protein